MALERPLQGVRRLKGGLLMLRARCGALVAAIFVLFCDRAFAQGANTGALTGVVTDAASGQPLGGVTVVAQGPQGEQAALTDETGQYDITGLVPGIYVV